MQPWIDLTLYPDEDPPGEITSIPDRVDFLRRVCAAWDFGILPCAETVQELKRPEWRGAVETCHFYGSVAFHVVRGWHALPRAPFLGQPKAAILDDPCLKLI